MHLPIAHAAILGAQVWNPYTWMFIGPMAVGSVVVTAQIAGAIARAAATDGTESDPWRPQEARIAAGLGGNGWIR